MATTTPDPSAASRVHPGGVLVAAVGFVVTRAATATTATVDSLLPFFLGSMPFLVAGLALSAYGVALAASDRPAPYVRTVAVWCLIGTVSMAAVVTAAWVAAGLDPRSAVGGPTAAIGFHVIVGGAIGGTLTGVQAARRRERELDSARRTARLTALNRILRHEVLNRVNVVRGYADLDESEGTAAIGRSADAIETAVTEAGRIARPDVVRSAVPLADAVGRGVASVRERYPDADVTVRDDGADVGVFATDRLADLVEHLVENAVEHTGAGSRVVVDVRYDGGTATLRVADDGSGLPERQRKLLTAGTLPEYDDPSAGFGLTFVRLLAEEFGARVAVTPGVDGEGTGVEVTFRREGTPEGRLGGGAGVTADRLADVAVASTGAGVVMGLALSAGSGSVPVIGALYGVQSPVVGWTTHLFHSLVFGIGFAAALGHPRSRRWRGRPLAVVALGLTYGLLLMLVAAGLVMPLWLRAVGIPAPLPLVGVTGLVGHLVWGGTLALVLLGLGRLRSRADRGAEAGHAGRDRGPDGAGSRA